MLFKVIPARPIARCCFGGMDNGVVACSEVNGYQLMNKWALTSEPEVRRKEGRQKALAVLSGAGQSVRLFDIDQYTG